MLKNIFPLFLLYLRQISILTEVLQYLQLSINQMKPSGLYIHIPFCRSKCIYCDFFSGGDRAADFSRLVDALLSELAQRKGELQTVPDTLYIGGGTPSLLPPSELSRLTEGITHILGKMNDWLEFTLEVNPEDVTEEMCGVWKDAGVNRLSMGVQSFNDGELKAIRRRHDAQRAREACGIINRHFDNFSIDLMFGLPGQTMGSWRENVVTAINTGAKHISAYSLMFEEGTPITVLKEMGKLEFPSEEESVEMWRFLSERLKAEGFGQYEISNYAKPGHESVHNSRYWSGNPYLGIGPSAHSYDGDRIRKANPCDIKGYLSRYGDGADVSYIYKEESLTDAELMEESVMLRLRTREGIDLYEFRHRFGEKAYGRLLANASKQIERGFLVRDIDRLCLSREGIMVSDEVIVDLCL